MHIVYFVWRWSYSGQMKPFSKSSFSGFFWDPTIVVYLPRWHEALLELQHMLDFLYEMIQIFFVLLSYFPTFFLSVSLMFVHATWILSYLVFFPPMAWVTFVSPTMRGTRSNATMAFCYEMYHQHWISLNLSLQRTCELFGTMVTVVRLLKPNKSR